MAGRQIGPYRVLSTLDETGNDSRVFLTQREGVERLFAVKLYRANLDPEQVERYQRGAHLAAKVNHAFVVRPIEIGRTQDGALFIATEHVLGESLRACLERQGRYHWREAANLVADAAEGLEAAHRTGLVHRDLSPERLIFNRKTGHAMVLDFGLARDTLAQGGMTKSGELIGGLVYMAPEQLAGLRAESPCDVYALGALLYELIAGTLPYLGRDLEELQQKVSSGQRLDLRKHVPEVPRELVELLDRAMSVDPRRRPPANVLAQSLRDLGSVETAIPTAVMHAQERGVRPALVGASFVLWFLVLGGVTAWALSAHRAKGQAASRIAELDLELEEQTRQVNKAHQERAESMRRFNEVSLALANTKEASRQAMKGSSEFKRRLERMEREGAADKTELKILKQRLDQAAEKIQSLRAAGGTGVAASGSSEAEISTSIRLLLDWVAAQLRDVKGGLLLRATLLHNRGHYEEVLKTLPGDNANTQLQILRARTLYKLERPQEAQAAFALVSAREPNSPHGIFCRALEAEDPTKTLALFREAVRKGPELAYIKIMLSDVLVATGAQTRQLALVREALEVIEAAMRLDPISHQIHESRAQVLLVLGTMTRDRAPLLEALKEIRTARVFHPDPLLRRRSSEVYTALKRHPEALAELRLGVLEADAAGLPYARVRMRFSLAGVALGQQGRKEAIQVLREAAQIDPALLPQVREALKQLPVQIRREVVEGLDETLRARLEQ